MSRRTRTSIAARFQLRYILAIGAFVMLFLVMVLVSSRDSQTTANRSAQVTTASGQIARLFTIENTASLIGENAENTPTLANNLKSEAANLRRDQVALTEGDRATDLESVEHTEEMADLFGGDDGLDAQIAEIASQAETVAALAGLSADDNSDLASAIAQIQELTPPTAEAMQIAVDLFDTDMDSAITGLQNTQISLALIALVLAGVLVIVVFQPMARQIRNETNSLEDAERQHRENNERQTFRNDLQQALEHVTAETEIISAVGRAIEGVVPENKAELLLANASESHLRRAQVNPLVGAAGCPIDQPDGCPAIRRGQNMVYESARMLNVCAKLPQHAGGSLSAVCAPLMFSGESIGVLHVTGPDGRPPTPVQIERLGVLATETSSRIGTLRASQATELQATTDGLTGLLNRRSLESRLRGLLMGERPFAVALADLDHFKDLNDTYGHEAGDRALRQFSKVLQETLRPEDVPGRYGGEEFLVILADTTLSDALLALERVQTALSEDVKQSGGAPFTASWGLTDRHAGTSFDEIVSVADAALYAAKRGGRNCVVVDSDAAGREGSADPAAQPQPVQPEPVEPQPVAPQPAQREPAQREPAQPQPVQPTAVAPTKVPVDQAGEATAAQQGTAAPGGDAKTQ